MMEIGNLNVVIRHWVCKHGEWTSDFIRCVGLLEASEYVSACKKFPAADVEEQDFEITIE